MSHRFFAPVGAIASVVVLVLLAQTPVAAQQAKAPAKAWTQTRTAWGDPDLQGVYTFSTPTPLERPNGLAAKDTFTEAELAELEEKATAGFTSEGNAPRAGDPGSYNNFWTSSEKGRLTGRTSLILDPENGRMPPLTERRRRYATS